jgi:hypothetical protein
LAHTAELPDNSDESDFHPEIPAPANTSVEIDDMQPALIDPDSDEEHMVPAVPEPPMPTGRSTRVRQAPVSFKAPARQTTYQRYNNDGSFCTTIDALVNTKVRKYVPGYGTFQGIITSYYPITGNYHILYDDGDEEVDTYASIQKYIEGTPDYDQEHQAALALTVSLDAAITSTATMTTNAKESNHYNDAMRAPDSAEWSAACDVEMKKLRERIAGQSSDAPTSQKVHASWEADGPSNTNGMRPEPSPRSHIAAVMSPKASPKSRTSTTSKALPLSHLSSHSAWSSL